MIHGGTRLARKLNGRKARKVAREKHNKCKRNSVTHRSHSIASDVVVPSKPIPKHRALPRPVRIRESTPSNVSRAPSALPVLAPSVTASNTPPLLTFFSRRMGFVWTKAHRPVTIAGNCDLEQLVLALREQFYLQREMDIRSITTIIGQISSYLNMRDIPTAQTQWKEVKEMIIKEGKSGGGLIFRMEQWCGDTASAQEGGAK